MFWPFGIPIRLFVTCEGSDHMPRSPKSWTVARVFRLSSPPRLGESFLVPVIERELPVRRVRNIPGKPTEIFLEGIILPYQSDKLVRAGWKII